MPPAQREGSSEVAYFVATRAESFESDEFLDSTLIVVYPSLVALDRMLRTLTSAHFAEVVSLLVGFDS